MTKVPVTNKVLKEWINEMESTGCTFWACPGPRAPYTPMATCSVCCQVKDMRYHLDGKPRLPGHPGYKPEP